MKTLDEMYYVGGPLDGQRALRRPWCTYRDGDGRAIPSIKGDRRWSRDEPGPLYCRVPAIKADTRDEAGVRYVARDVYLWGPNRSEYERRRAEDQAR